MIFGKWKPRYWVLKKDKFKYYGSNQSIAHLGVIDFNKVEATVYISPEDKATFKLTVKGQPKEFIFKARNSEEADDWVNKIEECISMSRGKHLGLEITDPKFWKNEYIGKKMLVYNLCHQLKVSFWASNTYIIFL